MSQGRSRAVASASTVLILVAACQTTAPTVAPTAGTRSIPPSAGANVPGSVAPTLPPATETPVRLPIGRVVFDEMDESPEGAFLGSSVLGSDGSTTPVKLPVTSLGFNGIWSPDGTRLLVNSFDGEHGTIGTLDMAMNAYELIAPDGMAGELECTDWTPDGTTVVCSRGGPDPADDGIYTVEIASGKTKRLTTSAFHHATGTQGECGGGEGRAVYSPDGSQFAFVQQRCGSGANPSSDETGSIAVASADGSDVHVIVPFGGVRTHPGGEIAWSPMDDVIAFGTQDGRIQTIRSDGTELRTIDLGASTFAYGPTWSPDGTRLLVTIGTSTGDDLYLVDVADGSKERLTNTPVVETFTDWAPAVGG